MSDPMITFRCHHKGERIRRAVDLCVEGRVAVSYLQETCKACAGKMVSWPERRGMRVDDPRKAKTLDEACKNSDGKTYNGYRLLSWLSAITSPKRSFSEVEIREMAKDAKLRRGGPR